MSTSDPFAPARFASTGHALVDALTQHLAAAAARKTEPVMPRESPRDLCVRFDAEFPEQPGAPVLDASVVVGAVVTTASVDVPEPSSLVPVVASVVVVVAGEVVGGGAVVVMPALMLSRRPPSSPQAVSRASEAAAQARGARVIISSMAATVRGARTPHKRRAGCARAARAGLGHGVRTRVPVSPTVLRALLPARQQSVALSGLIFEPHDSILGPACASKTIPPPRTSTPCWA